MSLLVNTKNSSPNVWENVKSLTLLLTHDTDNNKTGSLVKVCIAQFVVS